MEWTAVIILVQSANIFVTALIAFLEWKKLAILQEKYNQDEDAIQILRNERDTIKENYWNLQDKILLQAHSPKIPLTANSKPIDNSMKQPRTSGDVRRLTEQAWGGKEDGI